MKVITCECGFIAKGENDEEVVDKIRSHMKEDHPDLYARVPREDIFGWIEES
jgi:predicted small metal-binding protein